MKILVVYYSVYGHVLKLSKAVEEGAVPESRYLSYIDMVNGVEDTGPYRVD